MRLARRSSSMATDHTVVGVLPPPHGPARRTAGSLRHSAIQSPPRRGPFFYSVIARLSEGTDRAVASSELRAINKRIFPVWQASYQDDKATWSLEDLKVAVVGDVKTIARLALASVAFVWLIACANASNLLIARVDQPPQRACRTRRARRFASAGRRVPSRREPRAPGQALSHWARVLPGPAFAFCRALAPRTSRGCGDRLRRARGGTGGRSGRLQRADLRIVAGPSGHARIGGRVASIRWTVRRPAT